VNDDYSHYHKNLTEEDTLDFAVTKASVRPVYLRFTRISASAFPETHLFGKVLAGNCGLLTRLKLFYILTCLLFSYFQNPLDLNSLGTIQGFLTVEDHGT